MNLSQFTQGTLFFLGANPGYQREADLQKADVELKQQEVAEKKIQTMAMQAQMQESQQRRQDELEVGKAIQIQAQTDKNFLSDPLAMSKFYSRQAGSLAAHGDFTGMAEMEELSKGKMVDAAQNAATSAKVKQAQREDVAQSADDFLANPSQQAYEELKKKAVESGIPLQNIPSPNSPAFKPFVASLRQGAMTSRDRYEFASKEQDRVLQRQIETQNHNDSMQVKRAELANAAQNQAFNHAIRSQMLDLDRQRASEASSKAPVMKTVSGVDYEWKPGSEGVRDLPDKGWMQVGEHLTPQQARITDATTTAASGAIRDLRNISHLPPGQTSGVFSGLEKGTALQALTRSGANAITPADAHMYNISAAGLGLALSQVETLPSGRAPNRTLIGEFNEMAKAQAGEPAIVTMYKFSNAADILRNRYATTRQSANPEIRKQRAEDEAWIAKVPTPQQIEELAQKKGWEHYLVGQSHLSDVTERLKAVDSTPVGQNLPLSAADQALINKYK